MVTPRLFEGGLIVDDRGELGFVNDFDFANVKRFYWVTTHRIGFVRAWHFHRREAKYFTVVQGVALVAAVKVEHPKRPSKKSRVWRYILSSKKPSVLYIPPGYANGFMSLTKDTRLIVFSTSSLEESQHDDVRYPARYWDIWTVPER